MNRSPLASRHALPHLAKLRARPDVGPGGLAAFGAVLFALLVSTLVSGGARAEKVRRVEVRETDAAEVVVAVVAERAPTFQIFRVPGERTFAIELPGASLDAAHLDAPADGALLANARTDGGGNRGAPRVVLRFHGDVDYDARTSGGRLEVVFSPLGDPAKLKAAFAARAKRPETKASAARGTDPKELAALEDKRRALEASTAALVKQREAEERAVEELRQRKAQLEASLAALAQQRGDEEQRRVKEKQRADDQRAAALQGREQQLVQRVAALEESERKGQAALAALEDKRAQAERELKSLEVQRAALAKQREDEAARLAALAKQRDAEQAKLASLERRIADTTKDLEKATKEREAELGRALKALEDERAAKEQKLAARAKEEAALSERAAALSQKVAALASQVSSLEERRGALETRLAELERTKGAREQAARALEARLASLEEGRKREEARLAEAQRRAAAETERLAALERRARAESERVAALERRAAPRPAATQAAARAEPRISMAPTGGSPAYGFGGNSVDIAPRNRYELDEAGFEDGFGGGSDERGRGALSHVTVQRQGTHGSRVGVRVEGGARYAVERTGEREVVLTLFDTRAANLDVRRILDARDLRTSVLRVLPRVVEGSRNRVQLTIEMREAFPVRVAEDETMLWLHIGSGDA